MFEIGGGQNRERIGNARGPRQGAIADRAPRADMHDHAGRGGELGQRHTPERRRVDQQDPAGLRAHQPQSLIIRFRRGAAESADATIRPIGLAVGRRLDDPHRVPVGIQLLGDQQWQGGLDPLPHLGQCEIDRNDLVGADDDPGAGPEIRCPTPAPGRRRTRRTRPRR